MEIFNRVYQKIRHKESEVTVKLKETDKTIHFRTRTDFICFLINLELSGMLGRQHTDKYFQTALDIDSRSTVDLLKKYFKELGMITYTGTRGSGTKYTLNKERINNYYGGDFFGIGTTSNVNDNKKGVDAVSQVQQPPQNPLDPSALTMQKETTSPTDNVNKIPEAVGRWVEGRRTDSKEYQNWVAVITKQYVFSNDGKSEELLAALSYPSGAVDFNLVPQEERGETITSLAQYLKLDKSKKNGGYYKNSNQAQEDYEYSTLPF